MKKELLFKILLLLLILTASILTSLDGGDFDAYLDAAVKMQRGENIYAPPFFKGLQYYYSVFFALILHPFSTNWFITEVLWSLLSLLLLYRTFKIIHTYFDFSSFSKKQRALWIGLTIIFSLQFILYNISMIQVTMFLLWGIFESMHLINRKKDFAAGALLGLIINIKIMPVLILPYLFWRGHFKALFTCVIVFIFLLYLPAIFIGVDYNQFLLSEWWKIINPSNKEHLFETEIGTHSITAFLPVYLTETDGEMNFNRNFINLNFRVVEIVINISRILILTCSLFFLKSLPFKKESNRLKLFWEYSFFVLIIPLLLPHQQKYAFLFVIPIISYLIYFFIFELRRNKNGVFFAFIVFCLSMIFFSPLYGSDIIGKFLFRLTQHYRVLTIATLLLIPVAIYCNPEKIKMKFKK